MLYRFTSSIVCLIIFGKCVIGDEHIYGTKKGLDFYTNEILNTNETVPKNYTILFEYIGSRTSPLIDFCKINITAKSTANFTLVAREAKKIKAMIYIPNATNVIATIDISGDAAKFRHSLDFLDYYHDHASKNAPSKSLAMVFVKNATPPVDVKPYFRNAIGLRQRGDELLYFESRNVTNISRFPSRSFEYVGDRNTRITYAGFSFNSPTAIALINSTFVLPREFTAVAYDMNAEHFVANVSIYGFKNVGSQPTYKEIFQPKEICCWCSHYKKYPASCGERKSFD